MAPAPQDRGVRRLDLLSAHNIEVAGDDIGCEVDLFVGDYVLSVRNRPSPASGGARRCEREPEC